MASEMNDGLRIKRESVDLKITDRDFAFLSIQRGRISSMVGDRLAWTRAYNDSIFDDYKSIVWSLPSQCERVLDIGSGLGGIDILLNRHYGGELFVELIDGENDEAVMHQHDQTFNDMTVAAEFQRRNGVTRFLGSRPDRALKRAQTDLIISLQSWCFHYPASTYLDFVRGRCHTGTKLIVDVRKERPDWFTDLNRDFVLIDTLRETSKSERLAFAFR